MNFNNCNVVFNVVYVEIEIANSVSTSSCSGEKDSGVAISLIKLKRGRSTFSSLKHRKVVIEMLGFQGGFMIGGARKCGYLSCKQYSFFGL